MTGKKEKCSGCGKLKSDVLLCGDVLWCRRCETDNKCSLVRQQYETNSQMASNSISLVQLDGVVVKCSELLMFAQYFRDRSSPAKLQESVLNFFTDVEISDAKKLLIETFPELAEGEFATERRSSNVRPAKEAQVDDIINMFDVVDRQDHLTKVRFAAIAYDRLPRYGPEELNIAAVIDRQARTEQSIGDIDAKLKSLCTSSTTIPDSVVHITEAVTRVDDELRRSTQCLQEQINQLTSICTKLSQPTRASSTPNVQPSSSPVQDRSRNVIIIGVDENRNSSQWKDRVMRSLHIAAGREVTVSDAFRIGRFMEGRKRPILVKLHSVWDQRLVVSGARKLAESEAHRGVRLFADEPAELRRKRVLSRLKTRAENAGHIVMVSQDGVLSIDSLNVYSVSQGRLCEFSINSNNNNNGNEQ